MIRKIEVDIEPPQVSVFLPPDLVDLPVGKDLAAGCLFDMRQMA